MPRNDPLPLLSQQSCVALFLLWGSRLRVSRDADEHRGRANRSQPQRSSVCGHRRAERSL